MTNITEPKTKFVKVNAKVFRNPVRCWKPAPVKPIWLKQSAGEEIETGARRIAFAEEMEVEKGTDGRAEEMDTDEIRHESDEKMEVEKSFVDHYESMETGNRLLLENNIIHNEAMTNEYIYDNSLQEMLRLQALQQYNRSFCTADARLQRRKKNQKSY